MNRFVFQRSTLAEYEKEPGGWRREAFYQLESYCNNPERKMIKAGTERNREKRMDYRNIYGANETSTGLEVTHKKFNI